MNKKNPAFLILFLCLIVGCGGLRSRVNKGNKYYNLRKYYAALQQYKSAAQDFPASEVVHYNLGNALYKRGKFTDAAEEYRKMLVSEDRVLRQKAYYNLGNTYLKLGNLKYAIDSYKNALNLNQKDFDAKYNLEFALEQLKHRQLQQKNQPSQNGQSDQNRLSQPERSEEQNEGSIDKQYPQSKNEQSEMSKEDVMRMLEGLKGEEKNLQRLQLLRRIPQKKSQVEKDW